MLDTGGSTTNIGAAYGIYAMRGTDVLDNTVDGVAATSTDSGYAQSYGIFAHDNDDASLTGNRIRGLSGAGSTYGIYSQNSDGLIARDNDLQGSSVASTASSIGVHCGSNRATTRNNVIVGFATAIEGCFSDGDTVNTN